MNAQASPRVRRNSGRRARPTQGTGQDKPSRVPRKTTAQPKGDGVHKRTQRPAGQKKSGGSRSGGGRRGTHRRQTKQSIAGPPKKPIATKAHRRDVLRVIPVGGCEEVGRNMTIFEYNDDIIILDMGIQFPEENMPGIDYIVPNTKYLEGKEDRIRGVIFSHGHLDHIGAAPMLLEKLGNPTIYGMDLTLAMIKHKQEDYKKGSTKKLKTVRIKGINDVHKLGEFTIKYFQVEHSIMDAVGVVVETPAGSAIHPGDWTLDRNDEGVATLDYTHLRDVQRPSVLMLESLGAVHDHRGVSYSQMYENLQQILKDAPGRVIIGTFSSQIERVKWVIDAAQKLNKKVFLDGYSMKVNVEIARKLGYIKFNKGALDDIRNVDKYNDSEIVVLCTGAQGEENAVLSRIVNGHHRQLRLQKSDTVIFSSSIIPGNERTIQMLKDNMYRQCDNVIHKSIMDVHVSGHATKTDIKEVIEMVQPTFFMPVYANHFMLKECEKVAIDAEFPKDMIFVPDNGSIVEVDGKGAKMLHEKIPSDYVFVDGLGVSDSQHVVLRDRQVLAEDGMVVVVATVHSKTGKLIQNPDIISRGFVYLKDNKKIIEDMRHKVKQMILQSDPKTWADTNQIRNDIRDKCGQFLFTKTGKRPMVLPVVIKV